MPFPLDTVQHGECLALLKAMPDACVDAVITDPPYSSGGFTRGDRAADPVTKYAQNGDALGRISFSGDNRDGRSWAYWCALWMSECHRVLKPGGYMLCFTDWRMLPLATDAIQAGGFVWRGIIDWNKGRGARAPHTGYFRHQCEYVVWGTPGPLSPCEHGGPWDGSISETVKQDDKHHLTGKPTAVMRALVQCVPPGGLVLDPFAGSGTTVVAALLEGRHGIGFEQQAANVAISADRIAGARTGSSPRSGQAALFGAA